MPLDAETICDGDTRAPVPQECFGRRTLRCFAEVSNGRCRVHSSGARNSCGCTKDRILPYFQRPKSALEALSPVVATVKLSVKKCCAELASFVSINPRLTKECLAPWFHTIGETDVLNHRTAVSPRLDLTCHQGKAPLGIENVSTNSCRHLDYPLALYPCGRCREHLQIFAAGDRADQRPGCHLEPKQFEAADKLASNSHL